MNHEQDSSGLRVIFLHPHFTAAGGAGRFVLETGARLAARGHDVHCICIRAEVEQVAEATQQIQFHEIGGRLSSSIRFWLSFNRSSQRVLAKVRDLLDCQRPAVLFPQVFPANWWGGHVLQELPKLPHVWLCQEPSAFIHSARWISALPFPKNVLARVLNPLLKSRDLQHCRRFEIVAGNSKFTRDWARKVYGYSDESCRFVHLGVDHDRFSSGEFADKTSRLVVLSKITRFKNIDKVLSAVHLLKGKGLRCEVDVIGDGEALPWLKALTLQLEIEDRVNFCGRIGDEELLEKLRCGRALCLATDQEPFGLVAVEAMACGTPVIAVADGGVREIVEGSEGGLLVPDSSPPELAAAIEEIQTMDEAAYRTMCLNAIRRAKHFDWERTVDELVELFEQAVASKTGNGV